METEKASWKELPLFCLISRYQNVFVPNHCVLDRHENMLCERMRFVLPNGPEYMGLRFSCFSWIHFKNILR